MIDVTKLELYVNLHCQKYHTMHCKCFQPLGEAPTIQEIEEKIQPPHMASRSQAVFISTHCYFQQKTWFGYLIHEKIYIEKLKK